MSVCVFVYLFVCLSVCLLCFYCFCRRQRILFEGNFWSGVFFRASAVAATIRNALFSTVQQQIPGPSCFFLFTNICFRSGSAVKQNIVFLFDHDPLAQSAQGFWRWLKRPALLSVNRHLGKKGFICASTFNARLEQQPGQQPGQ